MSLIQEALKRQQEDAEGKGKPAAPAAPPVQPPPPTPAPAATPGLKLAGAPAPAPEPPPLPPPLPKAAAAAPADEAAAPAEAEEATDGAAAPEPPARTARTLAIVGGSLLVLVVAAIAGIVFLVKSLSGSPEPAPSATSTTATSGTEAVAAEPVAAPAATPVAQPAPVAVAVPSLPATGTPEPDEAVSTAAPVKVRTVWPILTLTGIAGNKKSGGAILNGEIIGVNESVQGVRVKSIRARAVELEYKGETRILEVGGSTQ